MRRGPIGDGRLVIEVDGDGVPRPTSSRLEDRVGALDGTLTIARERRYADDESARRSRAGRDRRRRGTAQGGPRAPAHRGRLRRRRQGRRPPTSCCARSSSPRPDVAIVDIKMPPTHTDEGLVAAQEIRESHPEVGVLVLSHYLESRYAMRLIEEHPGGTGLPAQGARLRPRRPHRRARAARTTANACVDPTIVARLVDRARDRRPLDELTEREREVLALMAEGRSNKGICDALFLSPKTVEAHVSHIFMKLDLEVSPDDHRRARGVGKPEARDPSIRVERRCPEADNLC